MQGLGMMQIQSLTLSNELDQFSHMRWVPNHEVTTITNPITVDHTILRQHLLRVCSNCLLPTDTTTFRSPCMNLGPW